MIYLIARASSEMMFEGAEAAAVIDGVLYDVVKAPMNVGLDRISDHIIDDSTWTFRKTDPRSEPFVKSFIGRKYHQMNEILLD